MAFPFDFAENFEDSTLGSFTSETDTTGILDFPHLTELARNGMAPYRGAYAMRVRLNGGTTDAFVTDTDVDGSLGSLDTANGFGTFRWYFYLGKDFTMANNDALIMFSLDSAGPVSEAVVGVELDVATLNLFYGETGVTTVFPLGTLTDYQRDFRGALNRWYCVEVQVNIDDAANNDGTMSVFIDDASAGAAITGLDQAVSTQFRFGAIGPDAGTSGTLLIDDIILDTNATTAAIRIGKDRERDRTTGGPLYFAVDHPIIGPGEFTVSYISGGVDGGVYLFDTDGVVGPADVRAGATAAVTNIGGTGSLAPIGVLRADAASEVAADSHVYKVHRGLYTVRVGTTAPLAIVSIKRKAVTEHNGSYIAYGMKSGTARP